MNGDPFAPSRKLLGYSQLKKKNITKYRTYRPAEVPKLFDCERYFDEDNNIIPDGSDCCWWHWIGLPRRYGQRHPTYDWQRKAAHDLKDYRYFYMRKPPKFGATTFYLVWAMHQACINPGWINGQVAIVVGTHGFAEAEKMIERCKEILAYKDEDGKPIRDEETGNLVTRLNISEEYNTKKEFTLNSCEFRARPAERIDSIRSQANMKLILIDEGGFFIALDQQKVRDAFEHYIGNSEVIIIIITTAGNSPSGFAYEIEKEENSIYKKYLYTDEDGLIPHRESGTTLFKQEDIDKIKGTSSYLRNYKGVWGHGSGNIYNSKIIDELIKPYQFKDVWHYDNVLAIDPAYGQVRDKMSSKFAGVGAWKENGIIHIRSWFELENPSDEEALARVRQEIKQYGYRNLSVDGHWTGIIKTFQSEMNSYGVNYSEHLVEMTDEAAATTHDRKVLIHPDFEELTTQLKSIMRSDKGTPDKKRSRFDSGDCYQQVLWHFNHHGGMRMIKV